MSKRIKYFIGHLSVSILIALVALVIVFCVWYPAPLASAIGVTKIVLMLLTIDVIVGPLFSLLVYKEGKKTLKFDLTVILAIQAVAFIYGFYTISQGRPAWIVYCVDRFEVVRFGEIYKQNINQALPQFQQPSLLFPQFAAIEFAQDTKQKNKDMFDEIWGGVAVSQRPERYVDLLVVKSQIQQKAKTLDSLAMYNDAIRVQRILAKYPQANAWLPLQANALDMVVLINKDTAQVVKIVDLRPWS